MNKKYGIYLITDPKYDIDKVEAALQSNKIKYVQYRAKDKSEEEFIQEAKKYKLLCDKYNAKLIINDRAHLAGEVGAYGVHVGQSDMSIPDCKKICPNMLLGVSARTREEVLQAVLDGADYIGIGAMFPTKTKLDAKRVTLDGLKAISDEFDIDIVTIGGINLSNVDQVINCSDGIAVCSNILEAEYPRRIVNEYYEKLNS